MKWIGRYEQRGIFFKLLLFVAVMFVTAVVIISVFTLCFSSRLSETSVLKAMQAVQTIAVFALPCLLVAPLFSSRPAAYLSLDKPVTLKAALCVVLTIIIALPGINLLGYWNQQIGLPAFMHDIEVLIRQMEDSAAALVERFLGVSGVWAFVVNLLVIAMLPAFCEELCFRGTLQKMFSEQGNVKVAIWACAIIFSAIHMQFYGFFPRMLLGAFFGYLLYWSESLWLPVIAHFTNNASVVVLYTVFRAKDIPTTVLDTFGTGDTLWLGIVSLVLIVPAVYLCRKVTKVGESK